MLNHFIRGYFDGDGCISGKILRFVCNSEKFIIKLAEKINQYVFSQKQPKQVKNKTYFILNYGAKLDVQNIRDFIYSESVIYLERKRVKFKL